MALLNGVDVVLAPNVTSGFHAAGEETKAVFVGTKEYLYLVPNKQEVDEGFWKAALSSTVTVESISFAGASPAEAISKYLENSEASLSGLHAFIENIKKQWEPVKIVAIADLKDLRVPTLCGGSVAFRRHNDKLNTPFILSIGKKHKHAVKDFYKELPIFK